ncbi:hypothetical protein ACIQC7_27895 [Kitasatospora sp. NPDC088556]|uniref:hypothetical protein n=1 Tax=Kitasatospora sp. NPDC088556 TaxID=3364076 RepID=UPI00380F5577
MASAPTDLPIYMRIGESKEIQVGTVELKPGDTTNEATVAISQVLRRISVEVEQHMRHEG